MPLLDTASRTARATCALGATILTATLAFTNLGCDKLKGALGKDADGGTSARGGEGIASGLSFLGSDFEGEIAMNMRSANAPRGGVSQLVFGMKKPKYRIDTWTADQPTTGAPVGTLLIDLPAKKGYALTHAQKMAMVLDFEKLKAMPKGQGIPGMPGGPSTGAPKTPPKIEKTGKKDVVAGYTCEIWNVMNEGKKAELCTAEGISWIDVTDLGMASPEMTLAAVASEANRFPLRVISFGANGAEEIRMEATKVEKKKLDDARFAVPPDYRVLDMSALMGGLGGIPSAIPALKPR